MATISNTPRPGYVWDATDNCWYPIGVGAHSHNEIPKTIVDAKGDLIVGTAADTVDRLAVGANGTTPIADSTASGGISWAGQPYANPVLNSNFSVWQRGTSIATTSYPYTTDRWQCGRAGGVAGGTVSRQLTNDTTNLPNIQYCARVQRDNGNTSTATSNFGQPFETVNSIPFAGKTVTLSFYARKGANFSGTSDQIQVYLVTGTGTDQNGITAAYTGSVNAINGSNATLTTTWQRFTFTATLNTNITEMNITINSTYSGTAGAADYYEITGVQIDLGSVALPYRPYGGTYQQELAACQRYFNRYNSQGLSYAYIGVGFGASTTAARIAVPFPVTMRTTPTVTSSNLMVQDNVTITAVTGVAVVNNQTNAQVGYVEATVAAGLTQFRPYQLQVNNNTAGYLDYSAEL